MKKFKIIDTQNWKNHFFFITFLKKKKKKKKKNLGVSLEDENCTSKRKIFA